MYRESERSECGGQGAELNMAHANQRKNPHRMRVFSTAQYYALRGTLRYNETARIERDAEMDEGII